MLSLKFAIARASALICAGLCLVHAATLRDSRIASPSAIAADAGVGYCFARVRGLDPDVSRLPTWCFGSASWFRIAIPAPPADYADGAWKNHLHRAQARIDGCI